MRKTTIGSLGVVLVGASLALLVDHAVVAGHDDDGFKPGNLVVSRSVYAGNSSIVTAGDTLPPGCVPGNVKIPLIAGGTTSVAVACTNAIANGTFPGVFDNNSVNGNTVDGSFGVTSPIFLDQITKHGDLVNTLPIDPSEIVTSFSSKSELALNLSDDRQSITFVGYRGGAGYPTGPNHLDVSNSNTPGVVDLSNPVVSQYYRSVAEVDANGQVAITEGNAYSGNNGRAAIKAGGLYYMTGNNNNGGLSKTQLLTTTTGNALVHSTGVELLFPGATAPLPPNIDMIGMFSVTSLGYPADKAGKDNNFRGLTVFNHTLYVTKGSGGNGINTVYQVGDAGTLPTPANAPGGNLLNVPITILPGLWTGLAGNVTAPLPRFPFGIWFANATTLYVADEGDGTIANAGSDPLSGLQKWVFDGTTWNLAYTLQAGLDLGVTYHVPNGPGQAPYPDPATDGLRNLTGSANGDGTVTLWAITSTVSASGDQGADPNRLVVIKDRLKATTLPANESFQTLRSAGYGEVLRGVSLTPGTGVCGQGGGNGQGGNNQGGNSQGNGCDQNDQD